MGNARDRIPAPALIPMLLAPFAAVVVGLYMLHDGWLAIVLYHAQILLHAILFPRDLGALRRGWSARWLAGLGGASVLSALLLFVLLMRMLGPDVRLAERLAEYGLSGGAWLGFVLYYGLLHPLLEQHHWDALRRDPRLGQAGHLFFAAYHVLVLVLFMQPVWVAVCFLVLAGTSWVWARVSDRLGGLCVPAASHGIADTAMMLAGWRLVS